MPKDKTAFYHHPSQAPKVARPPAATTKDEPKPDKPMTEEDAARKYPAVAEAFRKEPWLLYSPSSRRGAAIALSETGAPLAGRRELAEQVVGAFKCTAEGRRQGARKEKAANKNLDNAFKRLKKARSPDPPVSTAQADPPVSAPQPQRVPQWKQVVTPYDEYLDNLRKHSARRRVFDTILPPPRALCPQVVQTPTSQHST